jgi:WXG100 family type VII secretion target
MANINVTYDQMRDAAGRLVAGKDDITAKLTEMSQLVDNLVASGYVTDQSSRAFDETFDKYIMNTKGAMDALDGLSQFLIKAADAMQETDTGLAGSIRGNG